VLLLRMIAALPNALLDAFGSLLLWLSWPFMAKDRRLIAANIRHVYGLPSHSSFAKTFVRQNIVTQIMIFLETIKYVFRPREVEILGMDDALKTLSRVSLNSGVVIITAHHGAWELAGHAAAKCFSKSFHVLAKPSKARWLTPILNQLREHLGMKVLWTDSKSLLRDMMALAQRQEHLGFVMDQRPENRQSGHPSTFLGVANTHIVQGPALMATRKSMPVCGVYMMRTGSRQFRFYVTEILPPGHTVDNEAQVAQLMADDMSRMIRLYPEQWSWNYRRWKMPQP
jgi:KDO2-lipid IV(A) lauroyltransferase